MTSAFALDLTLAALLLVAIVGGFMLNRRIGVLKTQQTALDQAIREFGIATHQAHEAIRQLKTTSEEARQQFDTETADAKRLKDDLGFLIARADKAATLLEQTLRRERQTPAAERPAASSAASLTGETARPIPRSRAEEDLLKVLQHRQTV
jgi:hypothetical protein